MIKETDMVGQSPATFMTAEQVGDVTVIRFITQGIMDERVIRILALELYRQVERLGRDQLVLDFTRVRHFSSGFLSALIELNKKIQALGGRLALCGLAPEIRQVFEITKLNRAMSICRDEEDALACF
jgi:anti-sigma B factor antagonist